MKERERNVAHLWADKRVFRFFRKNFDKRDSRNLRDVYIALCELQSDFCEGEGPSAFSRTVSTYSMMDRGLVLTMLRALQKGDLIDYWQVRSEDNTFGLTTLRLFEYSEEDQERRAKRIQSVIDNRSRRGGDEEDEEQVSRPRHGSPVRGSSNPLKNPLEERGERGKNELRSGPPDGSSTLIRTRVREEDDPEEARRERRRERRRARKLNRPIEAREEKYIGLSRNLADLIQDHKNIRVNGREVKRWAREMRLLDEQEGVDFIRQRATLRSFRAIYGGQYVPVVESGRSWRNKFIKVENAIKRETERESRSNGGRPRVRSAEGHKYKESEVIS